jgi:hypothetical protein
MRCILYIYTIRYKITYCKSQKHICRAFMWCLIEAHSALSSSNQVSRAKKARVTATSSSAHRSTKAYSNESARRSRNLSLETKTWLGTSQFVTYLHILLNGTCFNALRVGLRLLLLPFIVVWYCLLLFVIVYYSLSLPLKTVCIIVCYRLLLYARLWYLCMLSLWLTHAKISNHLESQRCFSSIFVCHMCIDNVAGKPRAMDSLYVITVLHRMPLITFTRKMHIFAAFNLASFGQTPITSWVRSLLRGFKLVWSFHVFPPAKLSYVKMILQPWIKPADACSILQSHWKHDKTWES